MMELLFAEVVYDLHKKHGELARRIHHLEKEYDQEMSAVDTVVQELGQLKSDLATKFGEVQTELNSLESQISTGAAPDLGPLKTLIGDLDTTVRAFSPVPATPGAAPGGAPGPTTAEKPKYTHSGEGTIDAAVWPTATVKTAPTDGTLPVPLYEYAQDVPGGEPKGSSPEWTPYTGATQPV